MKFYRYAPLLRFITIYNTTSWHYEEIKSYVALTFNDKTS